MVNSVDRCRVNSADGSNAADKDGDEFEAKLSSRANSVRMNLRRKGAPCMSNVYLNLLAQYRSVYEPLHTSEVSYNRVVLPPCVCVGGGGIWNHVICLKGEKMGKV